MDPPREPTSYSTPDSASTSTDIEGSAGGNVSPPSGIEHKSHYPPTAEELKRLQRRIDFRIIPIFSVLYLFLFLCRQNIGNAKTFKMLDTLPATPKEYQLALTVFFFSYSTFDIPCNMLLRKLGPRTWLPLLTLLSGIVTACMGVIQTPNQLIVVRFLLGVTECGLFPGVAMVITTWYVKKEAQFRQALFFCAASMAGAFAGLLAVALHKMDGIGGYEGWRWILIIEGIVTVAIALLAFFIVQGSPSTSTFLSKRDREIIVRRLRNDELGISEDSEQDTDDLVQTKDFSHSSSTLLRLVFGKWHIYAHILVFLGISAPLYSISLCLPTILTQLSPTTTPTTANLLTIPIYITACIFSLITAFASDRSGKRAPFILGAYITMFTGFLIALTHPAHAPAVAYAGVFIAACGIYPAFPGMITWCSNNIGGGEKVRAISMAFHIGMGSFGGAMGANFYSYRTKGHQGLYRVGHGVNLAFVIMGMIAVATLWVRYTVVNRQREAKRSQLKAGLEEDVKRARKEWENSDEEWKVHERSMRKEFEVKREMNLLEHGGESVWFVYTI